MFVVSRAVDRDREFWWDALTQALLGPAPGTGTLTLTIEGEGRTWEVDGADQASAVHRAVWADVRGCPPEERDDLVEQVLAWAGLSAKARSTHRTLTSEDSPSGGGRPGGDRQPYGQPSVAERASARASTPRDQ